MFVGSEYFPGLGGGGRNFVLLCIWIINSESCMLRGVFVWGGGVTLFEPRIIVECVASDCAGFPRGGIDFVNRFTLDCPCWIFRTLFISPGILRLDITLKYHTCIFSPSKIQPIELLFHFGVFIQR